MKTIKDYTHLDYNELAFFKGVKQVVTKQIIAEHLHGEDYPVTRTGLPILKKGDIIPADKCDLKMKSHSEMFEGKSQLEYLVNYYNNGVYLNLLREWGDNDKYWKKLKFTGSKSVIEDILNKEQLTLLYNRWESHYRQANPRAVDMESRKEVKQFLLKRNSI